MTTAAQTLETETVVLIPLDQLHKSPTQPRRRSDGKPDADFVASIRAKGVIQPIVARKRKTSGWEIVFGHRRHTGSVMAERESIPAIVRDMTDDEVFEAQLIENVHREDMHPLDEADGFKHMMDRKQTAAQIAAKIGRPLAYVAQRLKLCDLGKEGRAALDKDKISLGVAILLARVPASLQGEAFRSLWEGMGVEQARHRLEETYLLRLDQAPFEVGDATLVAKAGACTVCPKRTGQQRELFPDAARADMCIDPVCFRGKLDAVWQIRKKAAAEGGTAVLEGAAAKKALDWNGGFKKLDDEEWVGRVGSQHKKVRTIFGKNLPPVTLARDEKTGAIYEIVKKADVDKALRRARPASSAGQGSSVARRDADGKLREAAVEVAIAEVMGKSLAGVDVVRFLTRALIDTVYEDEKVMKRRGIKARDLGAYLKTLRKPAEIAGLGFEVALWSFAPNRWQKSSGDWAEVMKATGVKFDAIQKRLAAEAKVAKKAKGKKGKGK